MYKDLLLKI